MSSQLEVDLEQSTRNESVLNKIRNELLFRELSDM